MIWPLSPYAVALLDVLSTVVGFVEMFWLVQTLSAEKPPPAPKALCLASWYWAWRDVNGWAAFISVVILLVGFWEVWYEGEE